MTQALDVIYSRVIDAAVQEYRDVLETIARYPTKGDGESPIETAMAIGFVHWATILPNELSFGKGEWEQCESFLAPDMKADGGRVRVFTQAKVGRYRPDFLLVVKHHCGEFTINRTIAVECDGFDYHDRTKAQIERDKARDRYFAERGIHMMRFAGSEIYRDAMKCVNQAVDAARGFYADWYCDIGEIFWREEMARREAAKL